MNQIQNSNVVKEQYQTSTNLETRISIHDKYSTNKQGFSHWIISQYEIKPNFRILELGCGTGSMWKEHLSIINNAQLILSDFSLGMVKSAKKTLGEHSNISYEVIDIQNIPYAEGSFDIVIANMMLYHVPDLQKALSEVHRVLKPNGKFYAATYGENGIIEYIESLIGLTSKKNKVFTLQNGKSLLQPYFMNVERKDYIDSLAITNVEDLLDYVYSLSSMSNLVNTKRETLRDILNSKMVHGVLEVPKEYGMFVSANKK